MPIIASSKQLIPYQDEARVLEIPAAAITAVPVASIAYANAELAAGIEGIQATASGAATALFDLDLPLELSLVPGLGPILTDIVMIYAVGVVPLSAAPTAVLKGVTYGPAGATEGTPAVLATPGGTISSVPATLPTAVNAGGKAYTGQIVFGTPFRGNADLVKTAARISAPMANTGTFLLLGAYLHYLNRLTNG